MARGWGYRRWVAAIGAPPLVLLGVAMFIMEDSLEARVFAGSAVVFFAVCAVMVHVDVDSPVGQRITLALTALMGLACGALAVLGVLQGTDWKMLLGGALGFVFFFGGSIAALVINHRRARRRGRH